MFLILDAGPLNIKFHCFEIKFFIFSKLLIIKKGFKLNKTELEKNEKQFKFGD